MSNLPTNKQPRLVQDVSFRENKKNINLNLKKKLPPPRQLSERSAKSPVNFSAKALITKSICKNLMQSELSRYEDLPKTKKQCKALSEYEKLVQKNRDAKMAFLETLKIDEVKGDIKQIIDDSKPPKPPRKPWSSKPLPPPRQLSKRSTKPWVNFSEKALVTKSICENLMRSEPRYEYQSKIRQSKTLSKYRNLVSTNRKKIMDFLECTKIDEKKSKWLKMICIPEQKKRKMKKEKIFLSKGPLYDITSDSSISSDLEKNIDNIGFDLKKMRRSQRQHEKPQVTYYEIEEEYEENKEEDEAVERKGI